MKTEYKYFNIVEYDKKPKTRCYAIISKSDECDLGVIKWFGCWRQYCFFTEDSIFSSGCLADINQFLKEVNEKHKRKNK